MADETDIERACRVIERSIERHEGDADTIKRQADTIRDLTAALRRAETFLAFDLRKIVEEGPDFNQAAKDTLDRIRSALARATSEGGENG